MKRDYIFFILIMLISLSARGILNGTFEQGEAYWNQYYSGDDTIQFYSAPPLSFVRILARNGYAGIWQEETAFTSGEWQAIFDIQNVSTGLNAIVTIGWTNITGDFGSYYKEIKTSGTHIVTCNNSSYRYVTVQCDASWIVDALVEVEDIFTQQLDDSVPPTYGVGVPPGIQSVNRIDGNTKAVVTWSQATDNLTPSNLMKYNVYTAESVSNVFTSPLKKDTFTGVLTGNVTGLDPSKTYYFGVRAEDLAWNEETNTVILSSAATAVPQNIWNLYE